MSKLVTNQDRFQSVIDALNDGDSKKARSHLLALSGDLVGELEHQLHEHLRVMFSSQFGFEAEAKNLDSLSVETLCGRLQRFPDITGNRQAEGGTRFDGTLRKNRPTQPLVTIITVVFNNASTIEQCIQSVLNQSYSNIEYIIVDGGSDDGTLEIVESFSADIDYYVSEPDNGLYNAMNKGLMLAKGEFIAFLNADDFYLTDAVKLSIDALQSSDADFSYAGFTYMDDHGVAVVADEGRAWRDAMLIDGIMGGHETCFIHRYAYDLVGGYDETYKLAADYHWFTRAFKCGLNAKRIKQNILVMRMGGVSSKPDLELSENKRLFTEHFGPLEEHVTEQLYSLKYYRHWHGNTVDDSQLLNALRVAHDAPDQLRASLRETVYNRTNGVRGVVKPAEQPAPGKLKIAVALTYMTGTSGGAERIAVEAAKELSDRGHAVTFVSCHGAAGEPYYKIDPKIPFIDIAVHPYKQEYFQAGHDISLDPEDWQDAYFDQLGHRPSLDDVERWASNAHLWKIQTYGGFFRTHDFDVVISHMPSTFPYTLLAMKGVACPPKQIACLHNAPAFKFYSPDYPAESPTDRHMRLASLRSADKIGVLFDEFTEQMPSAYQSQCVRLTNFISPDILDKASDPIDQRETKKVILSVGRLAQQKDHEVLLRAYAVVRATHPDWDLHIYGEGPLRAHLDSVCEELDLDPAAIFMGTRRDIEVAYQNASIFAFPSRFEGFGLTALEAMAHGLPVVTYAECEGVKYLVEDKTNGLFATRESEIDSLAQALEQLVSDQKLRGELGDNARHTADAYTVSSHVDTLEHIFYDEFQIEPHSSKIDVEIPQTTPPLSVAIASTYMEGGAGIAAHRLQRGLQADGHDAMMIGFSQRANSAALSVKLSAEMQALYDQGQRTFSGDQVIEGAAYFSSSRAGLTADQLASLGAFDLINLHWVENLITPEGIRYLARLGKPIVWTLHDMKPLTGGCHYANTCQEYKFACDPCPQLKQSLQSYPRTALALKEALIPDDVVIVTPSNWLADTARSSRIFANNRVEVISNGIDLSVFKPRPKQSARQHLGLPIDKKLILFTCHDHRERRKGFAELVKTVDRLADDSDHIELVTLGHESPAMKELKLPYTALGFIADPRELALVYSAVDTTILPTLEDNLPNVILESAACGTPVVAFDSGGVRDAVIDGVTGYLAPQGDCEELAKKISQALDSGDFAESCRSHAVTHFSVELQARRYAALFDELCAYPMPGLGATPDTRELSEQLEALLNDTTLSVDA